MKVVIDKEKLGEIVRHVERDISLNQLKFHVRELIDLIKGNPFDNPNELRSLAENVSSGIMALLASIDNGAELIKMADPELDTGMLKLEAAARILDDVIKFEGDGGLRGTVLAAVAEKYDYDAIRFLLIIGVGGLNTLMGHNWANETGDMGTERPN